MAETRVKAATGAVPAWMAAVARYRGLIVPVSFVGLLAVIVVPMPPWAMDLLICANFGLSLLVLLTTIYMREPLEFSVFPSLLLGLTLFRLVLNVASTRLILSADAATPAEAVGIAGAVISAFGQFVAGDSLVVGVVIFLILVIVQFVVITKGATRISEVAARFTLDAMPGKQMAIDADLAAGAINEAEARRRRERIAHEADFFGAMDGASKFVRGDAVAGIIITAINVVGGFTIGMLERGWPAGQTAHVFTILTIGDGLTAQIPAFMIAIASALIVTRSGSKDELGQELTQQLTAQPKGLALTAGFLGLLALTPLPTIPLLGAGGALAGLAWLIARNERVARRAVKQAEERSGRPEPPSPEALLKLDLMELEVGYGLVGMVDAGQGGDLLERISAIRRQLAAEVGFVMPPVRIRDNLQLRPHEYRIKVKGAVVAKGETIPGKLLAMDSGVASGTIEGLPTKEPAFGLDAWWIEPETKPRAEAANYTVVDATSVLSTHLTETARQHAAEALTREEVTRLVGQLKEKSPKLVEEVVPAVVKTGELHRVLQSLLRERVPIRDLETIIETLADWIPKTKDLDVLTEYVRNALKRSITSQYAAPGEDGRQRLVCVTLDPALEDLIAGHIDRSANGTVNTMPASTAGRVAGEVVKALARLTSAGHQAVVLASPQVRAVVRQLIEPYSSTAAVLGYNEIVQGVDVETMGMVPAPSAEAIGVAAPQAA
ncbi:MAG: flagellar biosynthesis protein FlhA [Phycisphaerae bacterium]|nr:flagellar biosynthesis protein FlhA [Phycisphaerae bacterium]